MSSFYRKIPLKITKIFLLLFALSSTAFGQSSDQQEEDARNIVQSSEFIIEGVAVANSSKTYFNSDSTDVYGSFDFNISSVYRGNLTIGTVQIVIKGVGTSYIKNGKRIYKAPYIESDLGITFGERCIVFAKRADAPSNPYQISSLTNSQLLTPVANFGASIAWPGAAQNRFVGPSMMRKFLTEKEIYDYLRSLGVSIPDAVYNNASNRNTQNNVNVTVKAPIKSQTREEILQDKINHYKVLLKRYELKKEYQNDDHSKEAAEARKQLKYWEDKYSRFKKKEIGDVEIDQLIKQASSGVNIKKTEGDNHDFTFRIANQRFTNVNRTLEFDVFGKVNQHGLYLEWVDLYFDYNTALFGKGVTGNRKTTITNGSSWSDTYYATAIYDIDDDNTEGASLIVRTSNSGVKEAEMMTYDTEMLLFHVKIETATTACGMDSKLDYNTALLSAHTADNTYGIDPSISQSLSFDNVYVQSFPPIVTCKPFIESITYNSPPPLVAGKNQTITIKGVNFGSFRGSGKVQFKNADDGGATYLTDFDVQDYKNWSDNAITLVIPSVVVAAARPGHPDEAPAPGTGTIKLYNNVMDTCISVDSVKIKYGLMNTPDVDKIRYYLRNSDKSGGITFQLGTGVSNNPSAKAAIEMALAEWSCKLNVDLKLGTDIVAGIADDGRNVIALEPNLSSVQKTHIRLEACGTYDKEAVTYREIDIGIKPGVSWYYDLTETDVPKGKIDFYQGFLHEIGHALGLTHVIDKKDLMYYGLSQNGVKAADRINLNRTTADVGALDQVEASRKMDWVCRKYDSLTLSANVRPINCDGFVVGIDDHVDIIGATKIFNPGQRFSD